MIARNLYLNLHFCSNDLVLKENLGHEPVKRGDSEAGDEGEFGGAYFR